MHLILDTDYEKLDELLNLEQNQLEKSLGVETVGKPKHNYFLIRLPKNQSEKEIMKWAKIPTLRYDSLVFGFKRAFYGMN